MKRGKLEGRLATGFLFAALFLMFLVPAASAATLEIIPKTTSPELIQTGSNFLFPFEVSNTGVEIANNVVCNIDLRYGFSLSSGSGERTVGTIQPGQNKSISYDISVSENTARGSHNIKITCTQESGETSTKEAFVNVESKYGTLNIIDVRTEPEIIEPGQKAVLYFALENGADYLMNEVNIKLNLTGTDIAPYGESTEKKLKTISAGASQQVSFNIIALPSIAGGIYKIPLEFEYKDVTTKSYEVSTFVSIEIGSAPEIDAMVEDSTIYGSKTTGDLTLKIVNRGLTDLKFMNINLKETKDVDVLSSNSVYVGDVDSDDFETADFKLKVSSSKKEIILPLTLEFRDSSNKPYEIQKNVTFRKLSSSEAGESNVSTIVIVVIIAVAGYFFYLHRKRKKRLALAAAK